MAYELKFGPLIVSVSPLTAVVMFCVPAILMVSPVLTAVPVESSPTKVMAPPPPPVLVMVKVSPDMAVVMPVPPAILMVSPALKVVPVLSSPTMVMLAADPPSVISVVPPGVVPSLILSVLVAVS